MTANTKVVTRESTHKHVKKMDWFDYLNYTILILFAISVLYPLVYLISMSLSSYQGLYSPHSSLMLVPAGFTLDSYKKFFSQSFVWTGYGTTVFRTLVGTPMSIILMSLCAYGLSKKDLPFRTPITLFFVLTIFLSGGLIPSFLQVRALGLLNTRWVLVVTCLYSTFNMLLLRNFFMNLPAGLEESARIDGASDLVIFFRIVLPLSMPIIATVSLWEAVKHWNAWFDSLLYITDTSKQVIQVHIRRMIIDQENMINSTGSLTSAQKSEVGTEETMKAAAIFVTMLPILCVYPFIQKYFVKGVMVGSLKG